MISKKKQEKRDRIKARAKAREEAIKAAAAVPKPISRPAWPARTTITKKVLNVD